MSLNTLMNIIFLQFAFASSSFIFNGLNQISVNLHCHINIIFDPIFKKSIEEFSSQYWKSDELNGGLTFMTTNEYIQYRLFNSSYPNGVQNEMFCLSFIIYVEKNDIIRVLTNVVNADYFDHVDKVIFVDHNNEESDFLAYFPFQRIHYGDFFIIKQNNTVSRYAFHK